jgi:hypothetical protein
LNKVPPSHIGTLHKDDRLKKDISGSIDLKALISQVVDLDTSMNNLKDYRFIYGTMMFKVLITSEISYIKYLCTLQIFDSHDFESTDYSSSVRFGLLFITFFTAPFSLVAHFADDIALRFIRGYFLARIILQVDYLGEAK